MSISEESSDVEWKEGKFLVKKENTSPQNKVKYTQKFCLKWLDLFHPWLTRCEDDPHKPFCRACQCRLDCNRCHLQRHERTSKHARNLAVLISKGEGAARQNLSIRQERSRYYQQRKKYNTSEFSSQTDPNNEMNNSGDYEQDTSAESDVGFQFVQTEASARDHYTEDSDFKQEANSNDQEENLVTNSPPSPQNRMILAGLGSQGSEGLDLLMQIRREKHDMMDSFRELMGGTYIQTPPKEKNHVDLFFESVSSSVKALSPKLTAEAKMRVSQLICELELRALTENDGETSVSSAVMSHDAAGPLGGEYILKGQQMETVAQTHVTDEMPGESVSEKNQQYVL